MTIYICIIFLYLKYIDTRKVKKYLYKNALTQKCIDIKILIKKL